VAQVEEWHRICDIHGYVRPTVFQGQYNILARECEKATIAADMAGPARNCEPNMLPVIRKLGMSFNAHSPLAWGVLTGKLFADDESLESSRLAKGNPQGGVARAQYDKPYIRKALKELEAVCLQEKVSLMESSLRWLAWNSALGTGDGVILGASRIEQVEGNVELSQKKHLPDAVVKAVDVLWDSIIAEGL
jgi:aflatoxin B1 aldehyde reductase